jgi:hypothetical protein
MMDFNMKAVIVLANLFLVVLALALLFLLAPFLLLRTVKAGELISNWRYLLYFSLIGLGFMMIEIAVIQRLMLFLGHPIYSLSVVVFSILLFSSLGSLSTRRVSSGEARAFLTKMMLVLVPLVFIYLFLIPYLIHLLISIPTSSKIILSIAFVAPLGFLMGVPFPLGIKMVSRESESMIPWCWSVNGAFSVLATVTSVVVAINFGITAAMALGGVAYAGILLLTPTFNSTGKTSSIP